MRREPLQRLLRTVAGALTRLLLFLSRAACHQRGHGTPDRYWAVGPGLHVWFGGHAGWESVTAALLPQGLILSFLSPRLSGGHPGALCRSRDLRQRETCHRACGAEVR